MVGISIALMGLALVVVGRVFPRRRVRAMFGVCDEWSLALSENTAVVPGWVRALLPTGLVVIAIGLGGALAL